MFVSTGFTDVPAIQGVDFNTHDRFFNLNRLACESSQYPSTVKVDKAIVQHKPIATYQTGVSSVSSHVLVLFRITLW
jgi:hypothetical protein